MEPRAHHVLIGLFTLVVAVAAVAFALWLSKSTRHATTDYLIVFNEPVRGLARGSLVQYNGIRVGEVADISLNPKLPGEVRVRIRINADTPVRSDTDARLSMTGLTGVALVALSGGSPGSPPPPATDGALPVLYASPSVINQLLANGDQLLGSLNRLIENAQGFLSEANAAAVSRTINNIEQFTTDLAGQGEALQSIATQLQALSEQAGTSLSDASKLLRSTERVVSKEGAGALASVQGAMQALQTTTARVDTMLRQNQGAVRSGTEGLAELGPTLRELRITLASLRTMMRRLEENPAGYLLGREKLQEFEP